MSRINRIPVVAAIACVLVAGVGGLAPRAHAATTGHIGFVNFSSSDVVTQAFVKSTTAYAQSKGYVVDTVDANGSLSQANTAITNLVQKKVDYIFVTVFPSNSLAQGLAAARGAHIPILTAGGGLAPGVAMATNDGVAPPMLKLMSRQLKNKAKILDLTYHPGLPCFQRATAFDAWAKNKRGIQVTRHEITIPGAAESSKSATLAWLARNPAGPGNYAIYNCYDDNALGAIAALKQTHRKGVKVYSFNATPPAMQAIQNGSMTASLWLNLPAAGRDLVDALSQIKAQGASWKPKEILCKYVIVKKANLAWFKKNHPEALGH